VSFTPAGAGWAVGNADRCAAFKSRCTDTIRLYAIADGGRHRTRILSRAEPIEQQPPLRATKPTQSPSFRALKDCLLARQVFVDGSAQNLCSL